jgi:cysteine desulfurase
MMDQLQNKFEGISFNGDPAGSTLYTVLSVNFPKTDKSEMILFNMDINNICVSGGSACSSGAVVGSHVISALHPDSEDVTVRFSFSKFNTTDEVDTVVQKLKHML